MNKLFKNFMLFALSLTMLVTSCNNNDDDAVFSRAPTITSVTPNQGEAGTPVTITGTNLQNVTSVQFGGVNAAAFDAANNTPTTITVNVPAGLQAGAQNITVANRDGTATANFTVVDAVTPAPDDELTIISFTPDSGPVGTEVTLIGTNLDLATSAAIGEVEIADWEINEAGTEATFTIPEGAVTGNIILMTEDEEVVESENEFTVEEPVAGETIFNVDPMYGPVGTTVALSGADFTGATSVTMGDMEIEDVTITGEGDESILTFDIPEGATTNLITIGEDMESADEFAVGEPIVIYDDEVNQDWQVLGGWSQTSDVANTDLEGTTAILVEYEGNDQYGGFQFGPAGDAVALTGNEAIVISVYGAEGFGGDNVRIYIKETETGDPAEGDRVTLEVVEGEWRTYIIPVSEFTNNPSVIDELVIQNATGEANTVYIDNVILVQ